MVVWKKYGTFKCFFGEVWVSEAMLECLIVMIQVMKNIN